MHRDCPLDCKVYVGNLGNNGNKSELERAFGYYGPLRSVWVARNPPGFAFVEFEDPRDATDAVRELDGRTLCGCRVRVELSNGEKRSRNRGPPPSWSRRPRDDYRRRSPPPRRSPGGSAGAVRPGSDGHLFPESAGGRDLCPGTGTTGFHDLSPDRGAEGEQELLSSELLIKPILCGSHEALEQNEKC
ncbi:serine arginine-rich splicing factor 3 isoform X1 [Labeo rohita]|uniref:Serine/arginine-rich splicing factor 3 n=1 Tax=Labeo rohita TaxID=84645 RepID=A0A498MV30_LABRO|nr:serine arginine-rich splicing factor 3 isoform X1 [Labeo rohita]